MPVCNSGISCALRTAFYIWLFALNCFGNYTALHFTFCTALYCFTLEVREAILCHNGCFFTHCVNGP